MCKFEERNEGYFAVTDQLRTKHKVSAAFKKAKKDGKNSMDTALEGWANRVTVELADKVLLFLSVVLHNLLYLDPSHSYIVTESRESRLTR
jgi:hypothetical protein